jgi:Tol biopolymer transport system component/DNA-binding winged helix-turn-helix (wHTH) protein
LSARCFKFDEFELDGARFELRRNGGALKLERIPLDLLILLAEKNGEVVTRQEIIDRLWGREVFVDTEHGINTAIRKIRRVLRDDPEKPRFVQTVSGKGYRFVAPTTATISSNGNENRNRAHAVLEPPTPPPSMPTVAGVPTLAPEQKPTQRKNAWARLVIITLAIVSAAILARLFRPLAPLKLTRTVQLTSDSREKFPQLVTDGLRIYFSELANNHWKLSVIPLSGGEPTALPLPFPDCQVVNISPDKSTLLIREGRPIEDQPLWRVPILAGSPRRMGNIVAHDASWSPDGMKFVFMTAGDVYLANGDGSEPRKLVLPNPDASVWAWSPRWSPDGTRIRFERYVMDKHTSSIWEVTAAGENPHILLPHWQDPPMQCCGTWSADGGYFFFDAWRELEGGPPIAPAPNIWAIRERSSFLHKVTQQPIQITAGPIHFFSHVLSTSDKAIFALSTQRRGELTRYDSDAREFSPYLGGFSADSVDFSRDAVWMAYTKFPQGELWRSKADGTEPIQLTFRPLMAYGPQWSPDGNRIVFYGQEPGERWQLYLISADGGKVQKLSPESAPDRFGPTWSTDGTSILFGAGNSVRHSLQILNLQTQQLSVVPGSDGLSWPRWSPDGQYISALSDSNQLLLFDFKTQKWSELVSDVNCQIWSNDGKSIYFLSSKPDPGIFRVALRDQRPAKIASLQNVRISDTAGPPLFLSPKDEPLLLRQTGLETEIYALYWDEP